MSDKIKIIAASETGITNANTTYLINDYKGTVGLRHGRHETLSQALFPLKRLNN